MPRLSREEAALRDAAVGSRLSETTALGRGLSALGDCGGRLSGWKEDVPATEPCLPPPEPRAESREPRAESREPRAESREPPISAVILDTSVALLHSIQTLRGDSTGRCPNRCRS